MTEAEEYLQRAATNRDARFGEVLSGLGDKPQLTKEIRKYRSGLEKRGFSHLDDPVRGMVELAGGRIEQVLRGPLASRTSCNPALLRYATLDDEGSTAHMRRFSDGSGVVQVSDALVSLCGLLSQLCSFWWFGNAARPVNGRRRGPALSRATSVRSIQGFLRGRIEFRRSGRDHEQRGLHEQSAHAIVAAALRFYFLQQRFWDKAAKKVPVLPKGNAETVAAFLGTCAVTFALAHEAAHFALGHGTGSSADVSARIAAESEADRLAVEIAEAVYEVSFGAKHAPAAIFGAMVALLATDLSERALFIRVEHGHPSVSERIDVLGRMRPEAIAEAHDFIRGVRGAAEMACRIPGPLESEWWEMLGRSIHPENVIHGDGDPIVSTAFLDKLCAWSTEANRGLLQQGGFSDVFGRTLDLLDAGDIPAALHLIGVGARRTQRLTDLASGLSFHELLRSVAHSSAVTSVDPERQEILVQVLACAVERAMHGGQI